MEVDRGWGEGPRPPGQADPSRLGGSASTQGLATDQLASWPARCLQDSEFYPEVRTGSRMDRSTNLERS